MFAFDEFDLYVATHAGTFTTPASACLNAAYIGQPGVRPDNLHTFQWAAPVEASGCVRMSTAQATGSRDFYRTAAVRDRQPVRARERCRRRCIAARRLRAGHIVNCSIS